jgi:hypothetical protein
LWRKVFCRGRDFQAFSINISIFLPQKGGVNLGFFYKNSKPRVKVIYIMGLTHKGSGFRGSLSFSSAKALKNEEFRQPLYP